MTRDEFDELDTGDLVRDELNKLTYMVTGSYGGRVTAVCTMDITNADEWSVVAKARYTLIRG